MHVPVVGVDVDGVLSKYDVFALVLEVHVLHFLCVEAALTLTSVMCIFIVIYFLTLSITC